MHQFVVVDIETTGLSPEMHKVTEVAALRVKDGELVDQFHSLVNPEVAIPGFITQLTGITDELVQGAPVLGDVLPQFLKYVKGDILVAHNSGFDSRFLQWHCTQHGLSFPNEWICTKKLAHRLLPDLYSKKLDVLCNVLQITNEQAHRAMGDVKATVEVLLRFCQILQEQGITTMQALIDYERSSLQQVTTSWRA